MYIYIYIYIYIYLYLILTPIKVLITLLTKSHDPPSRVSGLPAISSGRLAEGFRRGQGPKGL